MQRRTVFADTMPNAAASATVIDGGARFDHSTGAECRTDLCPVVRSVFAIRPRTPCGNLARRGRVGHAGITNSVKSDHRSQNCETSSGGFGINAPDVVVGSRTSRLRSLSKARKYVEPVNIIFS